MAICESGAQGSLKSKVKMFYLLQPITLKVKQYGQKCTQFTNSLSGDKVTLTSLFDRTFMRKQGLNISSFISLQQEILKLNQFEVH